MPEIPQGRQRGTFSGDTTVFPLPQKPGEPLELAPLTRFPYCRAPKQSEGALRARGKSQAKKRIFRTDSSESVSQAEIIGYDCAAERQMDGWKVCSWNV